jgi:hypothetical protein
MKRKTQAFKPQVLGLECRVVLSSRAGAACPAPIVEVMAKAFKLNGSLSGKYSLSGSTILLNKASGSLKTPGQVKGGGSLDLVGTTITGGTMTLQNKKGTLTIEIIGNAAIPTTKKGKLTLSFEILDGTNKFAGQHGHGTLVVKTTAGKNPTAGTFTAIVKSLG